MTMADRLLADLMGEDAEIWRGLLAGRSAGRDWLPPVDVYETDDEYVIELDAPGLDGENLSVELLNGQLVVAGERERTRDVQRYFRQERWTGRFVRTFQLGTQFHDSDVHADYQNGVLLVRLPKPEQSKPKRITVGSGRKQISK
jgi:HSP20 family protein